MTRWSPELVESKVRELLGEAEDFGESLVVPPLVDVHSSIYTPPIVRALEPVVRKLSHQQESNLIQRLYQPARRAASAARPPTPGRLMNPRSAELTQGLEPINQRAPKLIAAKQKRIERLVAEKSLQEVESVTGQPVINPKSRVIADRLTPERRQEIVDQRREILIREAQQRESHPFHPVIMTARARNRRGSVTERLVRDAEGRKHRMAQLEAEREREIMSECKQVPDISVLAKSMFKDPAPVYDRLYRFPDRSLYSENLPSQTVVPFDDYWSKKSVSRPVAAAVQPLAQSNRRLDLSDIFSTRRRIN
jgi:hypothetical protein